MKCKDGFHKPKLYREETDVLAHVSPSGVEPVCSCVDCEKCICMATKDGKRGWYKK
jgi:hypothetical protein